MKEFTDEQLIEMHKKGDHTVFEVIYARYKNMIRSLARGLFLVGGDNEDLMQEGVLGLLNAVNTFNGATSFSTYAYTCIKNSMLTAVNSAQSKRNTPLNTSVPIATQTDEFLNLYLDPEDEIIGKESERELMQKITQGLSLFESTVLKLFLEGLSYVEIGEKLNKTAKSIDNALQRIKRKISNILA
ncbi:MAG: sigma-70 family RNA polymerase sigma factor [Clostridiales bacterium]|nr:sigma-70 family RNA polymerase sigma factor [Clostridiales bacterium]